MESIFKDSYFGKPYRTRDKRKAIYHSYDNIYPDNPYQTHHNLILEEKDDVRDTIWIWCNDYGHCEEHIEGGWLNETNSDIVSEWEEDINEGELDKLAKKYTDKYATPNTFQHTIMEGSYKNGYKQAWEDKK